MLSLCGWYSDHVRQVCLLWTWHRCSYLYFSCCPLGLKLFCFFLCEHLHPLHPPKEAEWIPLWNVLSPTSLLAVIRLCWSVVHTPILPLALGGREESNSLFYFPAPRTNNKSSQTVSWMMTLRVIWSWWGVGHLFHPTLTQFHVCHWVSYFLHLGLDFNKTKELD